MKTLFKKWDFWYWLAYVIYVGWMTSHSPEYGSSVSMNGNLALVFFFAAMITILPAVFVYAIIKAIHVAIKRKKGIK